MMIEKIVNQKTGEAAHLALKAVETGFRKVWSILDAASEKKMPGEILSPKAVKSIQGNPPG